MKRGGVEKKDSSGGSEEDGALERFSSHYLASLEYPYKLLFLADI